MFKAFAAMLRLGRCIFSFAIIALGVETWACSGRVSHALGARFNVIPVIPWLPAIPWLAWVFGAVLVLCGVGLLVRRTGRLASMVLGSLLLVCAVVLELPKYSANWGSISLRTIVFEPLAMGGLAWLTGGWLERGSRYMVGLSLIVFGVDHFLALGFIADLIPGWIPWHLFWVAFFGAALIAAGLSIGFGWWQRLGAALIGLMFGIWVVTLHLPRVLGAHRNPGELSSLFIAMALWGGFWALASGPRPTRASASGRGTRPTSPVRRFLDFLAKMGLSVRDDPPKVVDPTTRQWSAAVDGFALSVSPIPNDDPEAVPAISIALRNVSSAAVRLEIPAWLFFYRIEITDSGLSPYGRALLRPERNTERQIVSLQPGGLAETQIPIGAIYSIRAGVAHQVMVSCQVVENGTWLSATTAIM